MKEVKRESGAYTKDLLRKYELEFGVMGTMGGVITAALIAVELAEGKNVTANDVLFLYAFSTTFPGTAGAVIAHVGKTIYSICTDGSSEK